MKKLLFGSIMALAAIGLISAQQNGEGLKISGSISTGLRMDIVGGGDDWQGKGKDNEGFPDQNKSEMWAPSFSLWHDDIGNGINLTAEYNKQNYGFKFTSEWRFRTVDWRADVGFPNVYGWFEVLNGMLRFSAGKVDDGVWQSPGVDDFNYSTGLGLRFEAKPVDGLNVGFFIRPAEEYKNYWDGTLNLAGNNDFGHRDVKGGEETIHSRLVDALLETSFGAKYVSNMFDVAAGFKLASEATGARTTDWNFGHEYFGAGTPNVSNVTSKDVYDNELKGAGFAAYIGFGLNMIENLTLGVGAELANLGAFERLGYVWISQKVEYAMNPFTFGLNAHQKILTTEDKYSRDVAFPKFDPDNPPNPLPDISYAKVYLEFEPNFNYRLLIGLAKISRFRVVTVSP